MVQSLPKHPAVFPPLCKTFTFFLCIYLFLAESSQNICHWQDYSVKSK